MATFAPGVERWRAPLAPLAQGVPVDFLLAWIDKETDGRPALVSSLGERGLFQVHPVERKMLKLSEDEFERLTTDPTFALKVGVRQAKLYAFYSQKFLADVGAKWSGGDFWKLVKLHHAAFAMPKYTLLAFQREHGRGPVTWREFMAFALDAAAKGKDLVPEKPKFSTRLRALTPRLFANAEEVGSVVPPMYAPVLLDILRLFGFPAAA